VGSERQVDRRAWHDPDRESLPLLFQLAAARVLGQRLTALQEECGTRSALGPERFMQ
jgi:hypothetical protein